MLRRFAVVLAVLGLMLALALPAEASFPAAVRGFSMESLVAPTWCWPSYPWGKTAHDHYGQTELAAYKSRWNANTLRFQISQPGLGSKTGTQLTDYIAEIKRQVEMAQADGFTVILAMQDQANACGKTAPLPNATTDAAWKALTPFLKAHPGVIAELFNEPEPGGSKANWQAWHDTHQKLVDQLRGDGVTNPILVDGGDWARWLTGAREFPITDPGPGRDIGYAIHPYAFDTLTPSQWADAYLAGNSYVVATEWAWNASACGTSKVAYGAQFLTWLRNHGIGMTAFAGDVMHHTIADWQYDPTACGTAFGGSGQQVMDWFNNP